MLPVVVLTGPTASGKSRLALDLALRLGGEILSCDSVAVYRGMDRGAAKASPADQALVPHHLIDLVDPTDPFTAGDWARHARRALAAVSARGRLPIIAGGTGLYLRALLDGLSPSPPVDPALRARLRRLADRPAPPSSPGRPGAAHLHPLLRRLDATAATRIHPNDTPKLLRALEVSLSARHPMTAQWQAAGRDALAGYNPLRIHLDPPRTELQNRINHRAAAMFAEGLVLETKTLLDRYVPDWRLPETPLPRAFNALGYAQATAVLRNQLSLADAIAAAQAGHRQYSKRQRTWFRKEATLHPTQILPLFGDDPAAFAAVIRLCENASPSETAPS